MPRVLEILRNILYSIEYSYGSTEVSTIYPTFSIAYSIYSTSQYLDFFTVWLLIDVVDIAGVAWVKVLVRLHLPFGCESPPGPSACTCLLYTSPSPRDLSTSRMPSSA